MYVLALTTGMREGELFALSGSDKDLRHTAATLLLTDGENVKVVSERLGHASIEITLNCYSHVLPTMQKASAERLDRMLS